MIIFIAMMLGLCLYLGNLPVSVPVLYFEAFIGCLFLLQMFKIRIFIDKYLIFIYLLLFIHTANLFLAIDKYNVSQGVKIYLFIVVTYIVIRTILKGNSANKVKKFLTTFLNTFFYLTIINVIFIAFKNNLFHISSFYLYKSFFILPFGESNYVANLIVFYSVISFLDLMESKNKWSLVNFIASSFAIIIINSRTAFISVGFILILYLLKNIRKIRLKHVLSLGLLSVILYLFISNTNFYELLINRFLNEHANVTSRFTQFNEVIQDMLNSNLGHITLGYGMGEDKIKYGMIIHNILLRVLFCMGILGAIVYILYILNIYFDIKRIMKVDHELHKYLFGLLGLIISSMVEPILYTSIVEYVLVIIVCSIVSIQNEEYK